MTIARASLVGVAAFVEAASPSAVVSAMGAHVFLPMASPEARTSVLGLQVFTVPASTFTRAQALRASPEDGYVAWAKFRHKDALGNVHDHLASMLPVAGPLEYLEGRCIDLSDIERVLSHRGQFNGSGCTLTIVDTDQKFRNWFTNVHQRNVYNIEVTIYVQRLEDLWAGRPPVVQWRGLTKKPKALAGFRFAFDCQDWLGSKIGQPTPLRRVGDAFTNCPLTARDAVGELWYGRHSDGGSQTGVSPEPADEAASGAKRITAILGDTGIGALGLTAPAGLAFAEVGAGDLQAGDVIYVMWTRVAAGAESDADTLTGTPYTVVGSGVGVKVTGTPDGASAYRFYAGASFSGNVQFNQYLETADPATGVTFTKVPGLGSIAIADRSNITPGASGPSWTRQYVYARTAVMPDGETAIVATWNATSTPFRRPVRLVSLTVPGAVGYHDWRREITGTWDRMWTVDTSSVNGAGDVVNDDSQLDDSPRLVKVSGSTSPRGVVPGQYVGPVADAFGFEWTGVAFAAHACFEIEDLFLVEGDVVTRILDSRYGADYSSPDKPNHHVNFTNDWEDRPDGSRWTLGFVRGPDAQKIIAGTATLRANLKGKESSGDRTGTFLADRPSQIANFLDNYALCEAADVYAGGLYGSIPVWGDGSPKRDVASFASVLARRASLGLSSVGAWAVRQRDPILTVLAGPVVSEDCEYGPSREGAYRLVLLPPLPASLPAAVVYHSHLDFLDDSFEWEEETNPTEFYNRETMEHTPVFDVAGATFRGTRQIDDAAVRDDYDLIEAAPTTTPLVASRSDFDAGVTGRRRMDRARRPPRTATLVTGLPASLLELGDVAEITAPEGGAIWTATRAMVRRIRASFTAGQVALDVRELVSASVSALNLEDVMAELSLGGSLEHSPTITSTPQTVDPHDPPGAPPKVPWSRLADDADVRFVGRGFVETGVTSVKAQLWDVVAAAMVHEVTITTTSLPAMNAINIDIPITKPGTTDKTYEMKLLVTGGAGKSVFVKAGIRL